MFRNETGEGIGSALLTKVIKDEFKKTDSQCRHKIHQMAIFAIQAFSRRTSFLEHQLEFAWPNAKFNVRFSFPFVLKEQN